MHLLIADDHDLVLDTLCAFLENEGSFTIQTSNNLADACEKIDTIGPFDLVLLDYSMPGMNGTDGLKLALEKNMGSPVAIMSGTATKNVALEVLDEGAIGFLPKTMGAKSLINAIRFMAMGEVYVPVDFMTAEEPKSNQSHSKGLSDREIDVLKGLRRGLSNKEIARELELY